MAKVSVDRKLKESIQKMKESERKTLNINCKNAEYMADSKKYKISLIKRLEATDKWSNRRMLSTEWAEHANNKFWEKKTLFS